MDPVEILIDRFDGGISDDVREQVKNKFAVSGHFDIYSNTNRLTPFRSSEEDTNSNTLEQYDIKDFWYSTVSGRFYGLGEQAAVARGKIFYKAAGDISAVSASSWTLPATAEVSSGVLWTGSFIEWATGLYFFSGTTSISKWTIDSTMADAAGTVGESITSVAQSIISPTDNNMYMFYNNKVVRVTSGGTITDNVVTLPTGYRITSAALFGNYIAIAMTTTVTGGTGNSIVILWDPTLSNFSEIIPAGDGEIAVLGNVEGMLVAICDVSMSTSLAIDGGKLSIRTYSGGAMRNFKEVKMTTTITLGLLLKTKVIKDFRLHFVAQLKFNGSTYQGLWSFGRKNQSGNFALTLHMAEENISTSAGISGFGNVANYWFFSTGGGDGTIYKTDDAANYTFTSFIESQKYTGGDVKIKKLLHSVFATYVALPAAGQVVLKYRKDEETSYTTLFTETTNDALSTEVSSSGGTAFPDFKEIQFRLESTGGAEITSWGFRFIPLDGATTPS